MCSTYTAACARKSTRSGTSRCRHKEETSRLTKHSAPFASSMYCYCLTRSESGTAPYLPPLRFDLIRQAHADLAAKVRALQRAFRALSEVVVAEMDSLRERSMQQESELQRLRGSMREIERQLAERTRQQASLSCP